jgi:hypothetical protein
MRGLYDRLPMPRQSATRYLPGGVMLFMHPPVVEDTRHHAPAAGKCQDNDSRFRIVASLTFKSNRPATAQHPHG